MAVSELNIGAAMVWPQQGRLLEAWAGRFRDALADPELGSAALGVSGERLTDLSTGVGVPQSDSVVTRP